MNDSEKLIDPPVPDDCSAQDASPSLAARADGRGFSRGIAGALVFALVIAAPASALASADRASFSTAVASAGQVQESIPASTARFDKTEVVYVTLDGAGAARCASVVNFFDVENAGRIVDFGPYDSVVALTENKPLSREGAATTFAVDEGTFAYQGDIASPVVPWNIELSYELNGRAVSAEEIAGADGDVLIRMKTSRNGAADAAFFDSYMLQATFTLPAGTFSDVVADQAMLAMAGQDRTVAFTVLPGRDGDFTIKANAKNFALPSAQIVALPYSSVIEMPSTDAALEGMDRLSGAVSQLAGGAAQLGAGTARYASGARDFASGSDRFGEGLVALSGSSSQLVQASSQINGAFAQLSESLGKIDPDQLDRLAELPGLMRALANSLDLIAGSAVDVSASYAAAYAALEASMAALPEGEVSAQQIDALRALAAETEDTADDDALESLVDAYRAGCAAKQAFSDHEGAFAAAARNLDAAARLSSEMSDTARVLRALADKLDSSMEAGGLEDLKALLGGMSDLARGYDAFHQGLVGYTQGVDALALNYDEVSAGAHGLAAGATDLAGGAASLAGGAALLNGATVDVPQTMREQMTAMMAEYEFPAFEARSFVSSENSCTTEVQFVMSTPVVEKAVVEEGPEPRPEPSFWDRLLALFS